MANTILKMQMAKDNSWVLIVRSIDCKDPEVDPAIVVEIINSGDYHTATANIFWDGRIYLSYAYDCVEWSYDDDVDVIESTLRDAGFSDEEVTAFTNTVYRFVELVKEPIEKEERGDNV